MLSRSKTSSFSQSHATAFGIWQRELDGRTTLIAVKGELDLSTAPRLKWMLIDSLQTRPGGLVLDLSLATFMDSTALGVLVGVKRKLGGDERLAIVCPRTDVLKIFEFAGMDEAFAIFPTLDEALADVRGHAVRRG